MSLAVTLAGVTAAKVLDELVEAVKKGLRRKRKAPKLPGKHAKRP